MTQVFWLPLIAGVSANSAVNNSSAKVEVKTGQKAGRSSSQGREKPAQHGGGNGGGSGTSRKGKNKKKACPYSFSKSLGYTA
jgi:hypothetical protein